MCPLKWGGKGKKIELEPVEGGISFGRGILRRPAGATKKHQKKKNNRRKKNRGKKHTPKMP